MCATMPYSSSGWPRQKTYMTNVCVLDAFNFNVDKTTLMIDNAFSKYCK